MYRFPTTDFHVSALAPASGDVPDIVVAIPARNEAERIAHCLLALARQDEAPAPTFGVVLLVNNSTDATAEVARRLASRLPYRLAVVEAELAVGEAHAGTARRWAMDRAAAWLQHSGAPTRLILTTDADTCVASDWIAQTRVAVGRGADAVAGLVSHDPEDVRRWPAALRRRNRREAAYESILTELESLLHPCPHDPWPRHDAASGASFAVTLEAYRAIGGLPAVPLGEDRALAAALIAHGARLRHAADVRVVTSARLVGRAPGGAADTLRLRSEHPHTACDARLERLSGAARRAVWRSRLHRLRPDERAAALVRWAPALRIDAVTERWIAGAPNVERGWAILEAASPVLARRPLSPASLPWRIAAGRAALFALRAALAFSRSAAECRDGTSPSGLAEPLAQSPALLQ